MAALKVEVYARENVKPSRPTHESLRQFKLTVLDQLLNTIYMPVILFFNSVHRHDYDELKESLSKTLSVLHPLAGRLSKDMLTIECNDEGADFIRANITNYDLDDFLRLPKLEFIHRLFPCNPNPTELDYPDRQPMLAVQANRFRCGGTALAICLWHGLTDGSGLAAFLQTWAQINKARQGEGEGEEGKGGSQKSQGWLCFIEDTTAIFPPAKLEIAKVLTDNLKAEQGKVMNREEYSIRRFVFGAREIERLRDELSRSLSSGQSRRPTRAETMLAFIWAATIRATLKANQNLKTYMLMNIVDVRKRLNPPLSSTCLGNIMQVTTAWWTSERVEGVTARSLVERVKESITKVNDDYIKKIHADGIYSKAITNDASSKQVISNNENNNKILTISSWLNFPYSKVDFGWGKPIWVASGNKLEDVALFMDTDDGGIEVWIGLPQKVMPNLINDNEFIAYVSFSQFLGKTPYLPARL